MAWAIANMPSTTPTITNTAANQAAFRFHHWITRQIVVI